VKEVSSEFGAISKVFDRGLITSTYVHFTIRPRLIFDDDSFLKVDRIGKTQLTDHRIVRCVRASFCQTSRSRWASFNVPSSRYCSVISPIVSLTHLRDEKANGDTIFWHRCEVWIPASSFEACCVTFESQRALSTLPGLPGSHWWTKDRELNQSVPSRSGELFQWPSRGKGLAYLPVSSQIRTTTGFLLVNQRSRIEDPTLSHAFEVPTVHRYLLLPGSHWWTKDRGSIRNQHENLY
jgi:hypothetical protein